MGGQLVHVELARDDQGRMGNADIWIRSYEIMKQVFGEKAVENVSVSMYVRDKAEFIEPFCNPGLGLALVDCEVITNMVDPKVARYKETGDLDAFIDGYLGMSRAAVLPSLGLDKRFGEGKTEEYLKIIEAELRKDPEAWFNHTNVIVIRVERVF